MLRKIGTRIRRRSIRPMMRRPTTLVAMVPMKRMSSTAVRKPEAGDAPAEDVLEAGREELVDGVPEHVQEPRRGDGGNGDEEAGEEPHLQPIAQPRRHNRPMRPHAPKSSQGTDRQGGARDGRRGARGPRHRARARRGGRRRRDRLSPIVRGGAAPPSASCPRAACRAVAIAADIGKPAEARGLVAKTVARLGRLDVLVNNAAIFARTPFSGHHAGPVRPDHRREPARRLLLRPGRGAGHGPARRAHRQYRGRRRRARVARLHPLRHLQGGRRHAHEGPRRRARAGHPGERGGPRRRAASRGLPARARRTGSPPAFRWAATASPPTWRPPSASSRPAPSTSRARSSSWTAAPPRSEGRGARRGARPSPIC